jgi:hypothetical protein
MRGGCGVSFINTSHNMNDLNGYTLTREWYNFRFENPNKAKHVHSDLYFYIIDRWNRFGQKEKFSLPTESTMEALGIRSYNTYKKALHDLIEFGFVEVIEWSKNQYCSTIIALSKNDKAMYKALDKAMYKADDKAIDKALQSYINNRTIEQENKEQRISTISSFYKNRDLLIRQAQEKYPDKDCAGDFDRMYEQAQIKGYKYKDWKLAYFKWVRNENGFSRPAQQPQITDEGAKWKAKLAELKSRQTVIEVTFSPTVPTYKILEYHNGKGMAYIAGVQRELDNWLATHWELIPLVKEVQL